MLCKIPEKRLQMFASLKRLVKHSAVYGIGHILSRAIGFLLLPLYTNYLSPASLGVSAIVFLYLALLTILYTYGLDAAFLRYYILSEAREEQERLFSTAFLTVFITSCAFSIWGYLNAGFLADKILIANAKSLLSQISDPAALDVAFKEAPTYFKLSSGILFFDALSILPFLVLRAKERSTLFVSLKLVNVIINLLLNILLVAKLGLGVKGIFMANFVSSGITFLTTLPIVLGYLKPLYSLQEIKRLLAFGLPYIPSTLSVVLMDLVDRFILKEIKGYEILGIYHANYKIAMFMALLVAAFRFAWHPFFLSTSKEPQAKEIFAKVLSYFMLACAFVYVCLSLFVDDLVKIKFGSIYLIGKEYWAGLGVVPVVMLAYILYGAYLNFLVGIYLKKKTGYLPFITGAGLALNIAGNLLLIPRYGMYGAAWATVASYLLMALLLFGVGEKLYPVRYEYGKLAKLALVVALYGFAIYRFEFKFVTKVAVAGSFPAVLYIARFFDAREIARLKALLKPAHSNLS